MEPLKRQVGYKPSYKAGDNAILRQQITTGKEREKIANWIKEHPLFKWAGMCAKLQIDKGNFQRSLKLDCRNMSADMVMKIEEILNKYGYVK